MTAERMAGMALFPLFLDLNGRDCLVLGGGAVAARKAERLALFGGRVRVWAREYGDAIRTLADRRQVVLLEPQLLPQKLAAQAFLVVCATSDAALNADIRRYCLEHRIFVNSATTDDTGGAGGDACEYGDTAFIFPSLILKAGLSVGISVDPPAPSLSQKVRQDIEATLPDWYGSLGQRLAACRKRLKELEPDARVRSRIMGRLTEYGLEHEGRISDSVFDKIINEEKNL